MKLLKLVRMKKVIGWILMVFVILIFASVLCAGIYHEQGAAGLIVLGFAAIVLGLFILALKLID